MSVYPAPLCFPALRPDRAKTCHKASTSGYGGFAGLPAWQTRWPGTWSYSGWRRTNRPEVKVEISGHLHRFARVLAVNRARIARPSCSSM